MTKRFICANREYLSILDRLKIKFSLQAWKLTNSRSYYKALLQIAETITLKIVLLLDFHLAHLILQIELKVVLFRIITTRSKQVRIVQHKEFNLTARWVSLRQKLLLLKAFKCLNLSKRFHR